MPRSDVDLATFLFSLDGRTGRADYWLRYALPLIAASVLAILIDLVLDTDLFYPVIALLTFWSSVALGVRLHHDRDRSGWFMLLLAVPIVSLWVMVEVWFLKGTDGPNGFTPAPLR